MKQTLHIFAKDARRFWPEIAISIVTTAAFARIYPNQWLTPGLYAVSGWGGFAGPQGLQLLATVLAVLVPVSWLLLIARVIHGESLVGDRQFWLTRPYEWKQLLAAKVLFLLVFLYLPFVAAQLVLLARGRLPAFRLYVWPALQSDAHHWRAGFAALRDGNGNIDLRAHGICRGRGLAWLHWFRCALCRPG